MLLKLLLVCSVVFAISDAKPDFDERELRYLILKGVTADMVQRCSNPYYAEEKWGGKLFGGEKFRDMYRSLCLLDEIGILFKNGHVDMNTVNQVIPEKYHPGLVYCNTKSALNKIEAVRDFTECLVTAVFEFEYEKFAKIIRVLQEKYSIPDSEIGNIFNNI